MQDGQTMRETYLRKQQERYDIIVTTQFGKDIINSSARGGKPIDSPDVAEDVRSVEENNQPNLQQGCV